MKVDNPQFVESGADIGEVADCADCPLDEIGGLCKRWLIGHNCTCPTAGTYDEACKLAEDPK